MVGLTVSPAAALKGLLLLQEMGCPALLLGCLGYGTGMVRVKGNSMLCTWERGQGMARVWHGIGNLSKAGFGGWAGHALATS